MTPVSCQYSQNHRLLALDNISYFNYIDYDAAIFQWTDVESCKQACLKNCSCKAALFQYGSNGSEGPCYLPSQLFSLMINKGEFSGYNSSAYIKVQIPSDGLRGYKKKKANTAIIAGVTLGALVAASVIIIFIILLMRRKKATECEEDDHLSLVPGIPTRFSFQELKLLLKTSAENLGREDSGLFSRGHSVMA